MSSKVSLYLVCDSSDSLDSITLANYNPGIFFTGLVCCYSLIIQLMNESVVYQSINEISYQSRIDLMIVNELRNGPYRGLQLLWSLQGTTTPYVHDNFDYPFKKKKDNYIVMELVVQMCEMSHGLQFP